MMLIVSVQVAVIAEQESLIFCIAKPSLNGHGHPIGLGVVQHDQAHLKVLRNSRNV